MIRSQVDSLNYRSKHECATTWTMFGGGLANMGLCSVLFFLFVCLFFVSLLYETKRHIENVAAFLE